MRAKRPSSLVYLIKTTDKTQGYDESEKKHAKLKLFEEYRKTNPLVDNVILGNTTFHKEYLSAFDAYNSYIVFIPHLLPDGFANSIKNLESCIGDSRLCDDEDDPYNAIGTIAGNPPMMALAFAAIPLGFGYLFIKGIERLTKEKQEEGALDKETYEKLSNKPNMSRRGFLRLGFALCGGFAFMGGLMGLAFPSAKLRALEHIEKNAIYLDEVRDELYKKE